MHAFSPHRHHSSDKASDQETQGLLGSAGWHYDLHEWFTDLFLFRGNVRKLRQKTVELARIHPGEMVLDVGCGTGTLLMEVARRVGRAGRVVGIDPWTSADYPCPRQSGSAQRPHRVPDRGDRAPHLPRSDL